MNRRHGATTCALIGAALAAVPTQAHAYGLDEVDVAASAEEGTRAVALAAQEIADADARSSAHSTAEHPTQYMRQPVLRCISPEADDYVVRRDACAEGETQVDYTVECPPEAYPVEGLWVSYWIEDLGAYGDWSPLNEGTCIHATDLTTEARRAFQLLEVPASEPVTQPANWALVNVHSPVHVPTTTHTFDVELLSIPVTLEVTAVHFSWNFGDGTPPLETDDPGRAWVEGDGWPDETWVGHTWTTTGSYPITVTTTWDARFTINGTDTWRDVDGDVTTTSTIGPIDLYEARSELVDATLN